MLSSGELRSLLQERGLRLSKRLGQHHLVDARVIGRIVEACQLSARDTVLEIGAGLGALTEPLAEQAGRVIAVEVDAGIARLLGERLAFRTNVRVVQEDILTVSWDGLTDVIVVGTIPYHITSPILISLCEHRQRIRRIILVMQEEVGRRLSAQPGTKAYGRLSVLAQYCWQVTPRFRIGRSAFFPQPEVDSVCLELRARERPPVPVRHEDVFFALVKAAFGQRRKTLVNCLVAPWSYRLSRAEADAMVRALGMPATARGESLGLEQFAQLANRLTR